MNWRLFPRLVGAKEIAKYSQESSSGYSRKRRELIVDYYLITKETIDPGEALTRIGDPRAGAQALFLGTVRNEFEGRESLGIYYDAYSPMAQSQIEMIGRDLKK